MHIYIGIEKAVFVLFLGITTLGLIGELFLSDLLCRYIQGIILHETVLLEIFAGHNTG